MSGSIEVAKTVFGILSAQMGRKRKLKEDLSRQFREALTVKRDILKNLRNW